MGARRPFFRLTRGGWAFGLLCFLITLGAINAGLNMTYLLASLLIAVFSMSLVAPVWSVRGLRCQRHLPEPAYAGEDFAIQYHVQSRRRSTAHLVTVEDPFCGVRGRAAARLILRLGRGESLRLEGRCVARRRGAYQAPPLSWSSRFPFGVAECRVRRGAPEEVLVLPARGRLSRQAATALKPAGSRTGSPSRAGLPGEEFRSLRQYKPGDNPRWIHWRASAHLGTLFIREMERERSAPVMVLLDSRLPADLPADLRAGAEEALETAIAFVAEVCRVAQFEGNTVTLVGFFPEPRMLQRDVAERDDGLFFQRALARLMPSDASDAELLRPVAEEAGASAAWQIVAVTPTPQTANGLEPLLRGLPVQMHIASDPGFRETFRTLAGSAARAEEPA